MAWNICLQPDNGGHEKVIWLKKPHIFYQFLLDPKSNQISLLAAIDTNYLVIMIYLQVFMFNFVSAAWISIANQAVFLLIQWL